MNIIKMVNHKFNRNKDGDKLIYSFKYLLFILFYDII